MKKFKGFSVAGAVIVLAAIAILFGAFFVIIDANNKATNYNNYDFYSVIEATDNNGQIGDHVKGNADAPVLIFEYADFQCPGCSSINPRVNKAVEESEGKLAVVYRNYLLSYHANGTAAASAAEAAGLQGYWKPYADMLFSKQSEWEYANASERTEYFNQYFMEVTEGNGDLEKFNRDIASDAVSKKISFDMGIGHRISVAGTPAFYIDGQLIDWSNKDGGGLIINGEEIVWDEPQTGEKFVSLLKRIVEVKLKTTTAE